MSGRFIAFRPIVNYRPKPSPGILHVDPDILKKILEIKSLYSFSKTVLRKEDFVALRFDFYNLKIENETNLVVHDKNKISYMVVNFPPQHIIEEVYYEKAEYDDNGKSDGVKKPPIPAMISGPSRLVFAIPRTLVLPYTVDSLLEFSKFKISVIPYAEDGHNWGSIKPRKPLDEETAIELPFHIILSPSDSQKWEYPFFQKVDVGNNRFKCVLWYLRATGSVSNARIPSYMRAIWSPALDKIEDDDVFLPLGRSAMNPRNCREIVRLSSDFSLYDNQPPPIKISELALTSLGGWLEAEGNWSVNNNDIALEQWYHKITHGRDHYVRVVEKGFLFPTGHKAALVSVTKRIIQSPPDTVGRFPPMVAYLRQQMYLIVREPLIEYFKPDPDIRRRYPDWIFSSIRILNPVTPVIDDPIDISTNKPGKNIFWPSVNKKPFHFDFVAQDSMGETCYFSAPLLFVIIDKANDWSGLNQDLENSFGKQDEEAFMKNDNLSMSFASQKINFARSPSDNASFETHKVTWGWQQNLDHGAPSFYPKIVSAQVKIDALEKLFGKIDSVGVKFTDTYVKQEFSEENKGEVFFELLAKNKLDFNQIGTETSGGIAAPNMEISAISRSLGPVGGNHMDISQGNMKPSEYFADAELLGGISLQEVLKSNMSAMDYIPKYQRISLPEGIKNTLSWELDNQAFNSTGGIFQANENTSLYIIAEFTTPPPNMDDGINSKKEPIYTVNGTLMNFNINFNDILNLKFNHFKFSSVKGQKPAVDVSISDVKFLGPLEFVEEIRDCIPTSAFSSGPNIEISPNGIVAGFSSGIPTIGIGIFSLQNVSFSATLELPFTGVAMSTKLEFSKREDPFLVSVGIFGGGGYFGLELTTDGVKSIEAALEFGGNIAIDIGVASGGVYIMAGIYFHYEDDHVLLSGYLRCGGELEILGLISLSLEFYMSLNYDAENKRVWGQASLVVQVDVLFFSESVELKVEREFANSPHFSFADTISYQDWSNYCNAFAEENGA